MQIRSMNHSDVQSVMESAVFSLNYKELIVEKLKQLHIKREELSLLSKYIPRHKSECNQAS